MAAKAEYTPGPWRVERKAEKRAQTVIRGGNGRGAVARLVRQGNSHDDANARLIAAAPVMASALYAIRDMAVSEDSNHTELVAMCQAIARIAVSEATEGSQP